MNGVVKKEAESFTYINLFKDMPLSYRNHSARLEGLITVIV